MGWLEHSLILIIVAVVAGVCASVARPSVILSWWGPSLVVLVLWPESAGSMGRTELLGLPLEYVPLLFIVGCSLLSGWLRHGADLPRMQPLHLWISAALLAYGFASVAWTPSKLGWARQFMMFAVYLSWFHVASAALRREGLEALLDHIQRLIYFTTAFAVIGAVRVFITPGRYVGDFTPIIEYRSSEIMALYSASLLAITLYAVRGSLHMLWLAMVLWASLFLTFSRTGMVGHCLATGLLLGLSWFCQGWAGRRVRQTVVFLSLGAMSAGVMLCVIDPHTVVALQERASSIDLAFDIFGDDELEARMDDGGRRATLIRLCAASHERRPWQGSGMGGYLDGIKQLTDDEYLWARSHNFYFSYLAEFGWLGFAPLAAFVFWFPWQALRTMMRMRYGKLRMLAAAAFAGSLPISVMMVAQEFVSAPYIWLHWILLASLLGAVEDYQRLHASAAAKTRASQAEAAAPLSGASHGERRREPVLA